MAEVFSFGEVRDRIKGNVQRQFPGFGKGRGRLLPYARPRIEPLPLTKESNIFVLGACFGRNLEKQFVSVGRRILSSPTNLGLPGSAAEQFQRYNIFNLDVGLNELRWALESDDAGSGQALLPIGDQMVDTQISWAFAHDPETARQFRSLYNGSYGAIRDADVVVILTGGVEQWYDRETRSYINTMPGPAADKAYPGRFELHRLDVADAARTLTDIIALVRRHSQRKPHFILAVSPVSQPMSYGPDDALLDQFHAKSVQRLATQQVIAADPGCTYLPALETAMWSDFKYTYMPKILNHTNGNFAGRVASDLMAAGGASDADFLRHRAFYHGRASMDGGNALDAIALFEAAAQSYGASVMTGDEAAALSGEEIDDDQPVHEQGALDLILDQMHVEALCLAHRQADAFALVQSRIREGRHVAEMLALVPRVGMGIATEVERDALAAVARDHNLPARTIQSMILVGQLDAVNLKKRFQTIYQVQNSGDSETAARLAEDLLSEGLDIPDRLLARIYQVLITALIAADRLPEAIEASMSVLQTPAALEASVYPQALRAVRDGSLEQMLKALSLLEGRVPDDRLTVLRNAIRRREEAK